MARETKAERLERERREQEEYHAEQVRIWPTRLMTNLEAASFHNMKISVCANKFFITLLDVFGDTISIDFHLYPETDDDWEAMDDLELSIRHLDKERGERIRKQELRKNALSKLTKEEREELGL